MTYSAGQGPGAGPVERRVGRGAAIVLTVLALVAFIAFIVVVISSNDTENEVESLRSAPASGSTASVLSAGTRSLLPVPPK